MEMKFREKKSYIDKNRYNKDRDREKKMVEDYEGKDVSKSRNCNLEIAI